MEQVQLEFAQQQPEVGFQGGNGATNAQTPTPGNNPFADTGESPRDGSGKDEADLNLTEGSVQGITPRVPEPQQVMQANPNTRI